MPQSRGALNNLDIAEAISQTRDLRPRALSKALGVSKNTGTKIVQWLDTLGIIRKNGRGRRFNNVPWDEFLKVVRENEFRHAPKKRGPRRGDRVPRTHYSVLRVKYSPPDPIIGEPIFRKGAEFPVIEVLDNTRKKLRTPGGIANGTVFEWRRRDNLVGTVTIKNGRPIIKKAK